MSNRLGLSQAALPDWRAWASQWPRMESNHASLGVGQASLPLDHGAVFSGTTGSRSADFQRAEPASSCWTMTPRSGSRGTRSAQAAFMPPPVFKTGSSSGRMTSARQKGSGGWNRTNDLLVQSQTSLPTATAPDRVFYRDTILAQQARGEGIEPSSPGSKPGGLPLTDPRVNESALRESNPPGQLGRLVPSADRPRARKRRKERESNLHPLLNRQVDYRYRTPDQVSQDGRI